MIKYIIDMKLPCFCKLCIAYVEVKKWEAL